MYARRATEPPRPAGPGGTEPGDAMTHDEGYDDTDAEARIHSLPAEPLRPAALSGLIDRSDVQAVWIPTDRPTVTGPDGEPRAGDVVEFWIEYADRWVPLKYTAAGGADRPAWFRFAAEHKSEAAGAMIERLLEEYSPLEEVLTQ